jgi:hypothetical protein
MTVADFAVGPPGRPDQPPASSPRPAATVAVVPDEVYEDLGPPPVSHESVKGLVLGAANILHQVMASRFEERPDIAVMTDDEAERIASALVSMSARNEALAAILARSDAASLAIVLSGYSGRIVNDVREARRIRRETNDITSPARTDPRHARPLAPAGPGVGGVPGRPGDAGSDGGGLLRPDSRGMA